MVSLLTMVDYLILIDLSLVIFPFHTSSLFLWLSYCSRSQVIIINIAIFTNRFDFWKASQTYGLPIFLLIYYFYAVTGEHCPLSAEFIEICFGASQWEDLPLHMFREGVYPLISKLVILCEHLVTWIVLLLSIKKVHPPFLLWFSIFQLLL